MQVFVRSTRNTWSEWIPTHRPSRTTSVNSSTSSISWQISAVSCKCDVTFPQLCGELICLKSNYFVLLVFFSFDKANGRYTPHNKAWIKEKIYILLRKQAGKWSECTCTLLSEYICTLCTFLGIPTLRTSNMPFIDEHKLKTISSQNDCFLTMVKYFMGYFRS